MRTVATIVALALAGCGGAALPSETVAERFDAPEAEAARERAPDMYGAADRARRDVQRAEQAGDELAAADHATRARLLLAAAVAEADRLDLEEQRLAAEASERAAEEQIVRDTEARSAVDRELSRGEASRVASAQAAAAFSQAAEDEGRRHRAQATERNQVRREAARILARRARLLVAAAQAMDAGEPAVARVAALLEESGRARDGAGAIRKAEEAVRAALAALGAARTGADGPSADEHAALVTAAGEAGLEVEQRDGGLVVRVADAFRGHGRQIPHASRRRLVLTAALVTAHPHGVVHVRAFSANGNARARRRTADGRATAAAAILIGAGAPESRVHPAGVADANEDTNDVELVFLAYGPRR